MKVHHIGYLVKNLNLAINEFKQLGFKEQSGPIYDDYRKIKISFMQEPDGMLIELVAPSSKDSVVANLLKRYHNSPYHICYEVKDFEQQVINLQNNGYLKMEAAHAAVAINNRRIIFLMNPNIGMIELVEAEK